MKIEKEWLRNGNIILTYYNSNDDSNPIVTRKVINIIHLKNTQSGEETQIKADNILRLSSKSMNGSYSFYENYKTHRDALYHEDTLFDKSLIIFKLSDYDIEGLLMECV